MLRAMEEELGASSHVHAHLAVSDIYLFMRVHKGKGEYKSENVMNFCYFVCLPRYWFSGNG